MLLGLCIMLAVVFTVSFNIISRISLSTTRHESAYTILWQGCCALLAPLFLPFDRFSIAVNPHVLLWFALSVVLWALVDAFMFSAFKYEEASVLAAIFPLNFVFTFVVSVVFFQAGIKPTLVIGFLIIMVASLLIGVYSTRFRLSKGIVFALLYSFFLGAALGFNSELVKSFSIPPYMFAAFLSRLSMSRDQLLDEVAGPHCSAASSSSVHGSLPACITDSFPLFTLQEDVCFMEPQKALP